MLNQARETAVNFAQMRTIANRLDTAYTFEIVWTLLENIEECACVANRNGYFVKLNDAWEKYLGWTKTELMSKPWLEFVHLDDREKTVRAAEAMEKSSLIGSFKNRYRRKDGTYQTLRWFALRWGKGGFSLCIAKPDNTN